MRRQISQYSRNADQYLEGEVPFAPLVAVEVMKLEHGVGPRVGDNDHAEIERPRRRGGGR